MQEEGDGSDYSSMVAGSIRQGTQQTSWRWWPAYSSTIAFELVKLEDDRHIIRVILNGSALRLIPRMSIDDEGLLKKQSISARQVFGEMSADGRGRMMDLSDFEQVIRILEQTGHRGGLPLDDESFGAAAIGVEGG